MKAWSFEELKARGSIERVIVEDEFLARLATGKPLKIYQGFDPTSPDLHIGHMVGFRATIIFSSAACPGTPTGNIPERSNAINASSCGHCP